MGDGVFTILSTILDREVRYRVEVQGGRMVTKGTLRLTAEGSGTQVTWQEQGDFGRNPLLGYVARSMDRLQGAQMEGSLARLRELVRDTEG
jgi:carbon monoxide dehydrogenase subunit G